MTARQSNAELVRALAAATGLTRHGVYKCFREKRVPRNPLVARAWSKALAAARAKLAKAAP